MEMRYSWDVTKKRLTEREIEILRQASRMVRRGCKVKDMKMMLDDARSTGIVK